jgi:uncharacterized RDD family membrane protein YckC
MGDLDVMTQPPQDPWENPSGGNPPQNPYGGQQPPNFEKPPQSGDPYGQGPPPGQGPPYGQGPPPGQGPPQPPPYGGNYGGGQQGGGYGQQGGGYGQGGLPPYSGGPEQFGQPSAVPMLASKGKRLGGILIDWVIFIFLTCLFALPFGTGSGDVVEVNGNNYEYHWDRLYTGPQIVASLLSLLLAFLYFWLLTYRWEGQTLGKKAVSIRVVREDTGGPVDSKAAGTRSIVFVLLSQVCCFGFLVDAIWIFTNPKNQTLHDKAAGTVVVDAKGLNPYQQGGYGQGARPY